MLELQVNLKSNTLSIGEVARRAAIRTSALRYYEDVGLIEPQIRVGGRRQYGGDVFNRLALIQHAKEVGFTIADIKLLLSGANASRRPSEAWHELARRKRAELDATIARARRMKRLLDRTLQCRCLDLDECGRKLRLRRTTSARRTAT